VESKLGPLGTPATYWPEDAEFGGMNGRGNRSTRRKPAPAPLCPPQIPLDQPRDWTWAAAVGSQRLTTSAMARPMRWRVNRANVSLAHLPTFTQNLVFIRRSRFLSLIFPPTVYDGHVVLGNEGLIWSVAHVNISWDMSKRAWVHESAWLNTPATHCGHSGNYIFGPYTA
jgi:hypothetical protein